jgi:hypothetical protein
MNNDFEDFLDSAIGEGKYKILPGKTKEELEYEVRNLDRKVRELEENKVYLEKLLEEEKSKKADNTIPLINFVEYIKSLENRISDLEGRDTTWSDINTPLNG